PFPSTTLFRSSKNARTLRRRLIRAARASSVHSHITTAGTYKMASRLSQRTNIRAARSPSRPPPAAKNIKGCVSVTVACGSTTALPRFRAAAIRAAALACDHGTAERRIEQVPNGGVGPLQQRVGRIHVDGAGHRARGSHLAGLPRRRHEPIDEVAQAARARGAYAAAQPSDIVGVEGDGNRPPRHNIIILYHFFMV